MTKAERVIWELSDLYDFYLRLEQLKRKNRAGDASSAVFMEIVEAAREEFRAGEKLSLEEIKRAVLK